MSHTDLDLIEQLRLFRPQNKIQLRYWCYSFLAMLLPLRPICDGHCSPLDYLAHSFFPDFKQHPTNTDCIVWANRGGGKTQLAAAASLLDMAFKPKCEVRILGGSLEQSLRMYEYFAAFASQYSYGKVLKSRCDFPNSSNAQVLTQSATNVRGRHVQKLRCDEVELFDEKVFAAAQFVPQSKDGIASSCQVLSTMHQPYGLMQSVVERAAKTNTPIFKWCIFEVIEKCTSRSCSQCPLWPDCAGKAKNAAGYYPIEDAVTQMQRSSRPAWETEMLCLRPSLENVVFADFDESIHVKPLTYDPALPLYRAIDFGFVNPFVCLFIQVDHAGTVRIIDEYVRTKAPIAAHADAIKLRTPCSPRQVVATYCDPAGAGANDITGTSSVAELRAYGIPCKYRHSHIMAGVELIRRALKNGKGESSILISPKCACLIRALKCYHYPAAVTGSELPEKDGIFDHPIDALRYFYVNYSLLPFQDFAY